MMAKITPRTIQAIHALPEIGSQGTMFLNFSPPFTRALKSITSKSDNASVKEEFKADILAAKETFPLKIETTYFSSISGSKAETRVTALTVNTHPGLLPHFTAATDHKPLEGIFKKDLFEVENPRLQRIWEKLPQYTFTLKWVAGKGHHIADALSRAPLFAPADLDDMHINTEKTCLVTVDVKKTEFTAILDSMDADYIMLKNYVLNQTYKSRYANHLKAVFDNLSVDGELVYLDAKRIVMPLKGVKPVLKLLHSTLVGMNKTYNLALSLYYWLAMLNDIKQLIDGCEGCASYRPSQTKNPRSTEPQSLSLGPPISQVGLDMSKFGGSQYVLIS